MEWLSSGFNILLIILGFGLLIFIHELGHFLAAKWAGIRTEAFAIGMGPAAISWRKGIGLRFGSTAREYERRARAHLEEGGGAAPSAASLEQLYRIGDRIGLGETEYSLRWLPIGGFVKMLGQEDANPNYVSDDPRSYNRCPVGKRMIVVSAGVVMNLVLAVILFIVAFMAGVKFEAPILGSVSRSLPAGRTMANNAESLGVQQPGLKPGDEVVRIDGEPAQTFADLQIASAMSKPGVPILLTINRDGVSEPLQFTLLPEKDPITGLLSIGVSPGLSNVLIGKDSVEQMTIALQKLGLHQQGVRPGMQLTAVNGQPVQTFEQFQHVVEQSTGTSVTTTWRQLDKHGNPRGDIVTATLEVSPLYSVQWHPREGADEFAAYDDGLLGLVPLVQIAEVSDSLNKGVLLDGDIVLRAGSVEGPGMTAFRRELKQHAGRQVSMLVLRNGEEVAVSANVDDEGRLNVYTAPAWDLPVTAQVVERVRDVSNEGQDSIVATPVAALALLPRTRIEEVGGVTVTDWASLRHGLREATRRAWEEQDGAAVQLVTTLPTPGSPREATLLRLSETDVRSLHELGWQSNLPGDLFEPIYTTRSAHGNPVKAVAMGFDETHKLIMMTYLTIDRLVRRSVGVDQLRGPVGIVHIGTKIADRGLTYLIFFLAMISVNLAVINFLPMPIVDGGLFLFLVYEKIKGRPPSLAFQNAATMVGLFLIGTLFVVTFYNDVVRLLS